MLALALLEAELGRWIEAGRRPQLWWRDDDAQRVTPALWRLLDIAQKVGAPVALAVVPQGLDRKLPVYLRDHRKVTVMQHGVDHDNAGLPTAPCQFAPDQSAWAVAEAIRASGEALKAFDRYAPVYVPPWNRLQPNVVAALQTLEIHGVSAFGGPRSTEPLIQVDVHLDLMRWGPSPRFLGRDKFLDRLRRLLRERRRLQQWSEPVGILTHHLQHDEAAWAFLDSLLSWEPLAQAAVWRRPEHLFGIDLSLKRKPALVLA
jgi:hypothetical protein